MKSTIENLDNWILFKNVCNRPLNSKNTTIQTFLNTFNRGVFYLRQKKKFHSDMWIMGGTWYDTRNGSVDGPGRVRLGTLKHLMLVGALILRRARRSAGRCSARAFHRELKFHGEVYCGSGTLPAPVELCANGIESLLLSLRMPHGDPLRWPKQAREHDKWFIVTVEQVSRVSHSTQPCLYFRLRAPLSTFYCFYNIKFGPVVDGRARPLWSTNNTSVGSHSGATTTNFFPHNNIP